MNCLIKKILREELNKIIIETNNFWFHGTPDVREIEKNSGFTNRKTSIDYIKDIPKYYELQRKLKISRENNNDDEYFKYLDLVPKYKGRFTFTSPIFLSNKSNVAKTYADPKRSFDYQNAVSKLIKVTVKKGKSVEIIAHGDRFRFINVDKVKKGFVDGGINGNEFNEVLSRINFYNLNKNGIRTEIIAALGQWFNFDYIDVIGALDSYNGGVIESTIRIILNPNTISIVK